MYHINNLFYPESEQLYHYLTLLKSTTKKINSDLSYTIYMVEYRVKEETKVIYVVKSECIYIILMILLPTFHTSNGVNYFI
jgi:hypothetical protein